MENISQKSKIQSDLLRWFKKNGRDLPWRRTKDPYAIWVSEIMLQQTQVATVIPYYRRFLKSFPTIRHLAKAGLSDVLKVWEGLGYYSRARNLHRASQIVLERFQGTLPCSLVELLSLPGIGRSTAGSILSFAFQKEAPVLDGNVKRILSRLYALPGDPENGKTNQRLWKISESLIPKGYSNPFYQALMDIGSLICTLRDPRCGHCPLHQFCRGKASGEPEKFPFKKRKRAIPRMESVSVVIERNGKVLLNQRPPSGLLGGLWEFPNWKIEEKEMIESRLRLRKDIKQEMGMNVEVKEPLGIFHQTFSHFKLTLHVFSCQPLGDKGKGKWVPFRKLHLFPMSRIHRRIAQAIEGETRE